MTGPHVGQHSSDLIRLPLLYLYGGVWLDALCLNAFEDPGTPYEVVAFKVSMGPELSFLFNGFIAVRRGSVCIKCWHGISARCGMAQRAVWGCIHTRCWRICRSTSRPRWTESAHRSFDSKTGWDGPKFFEENLLLFDCVTEAYWVQGLMDWNGRKQYELLDLQRGEDGLDNARVKEAEALVQGMLSMSSTMKLPHGLVTAGRDYLTDIRDNPENHDADIRPGTFAAYLRQASETFEQTKELVPLKMPVIEKVLLQAGITEVVG
ncbi:unnamed protein product [Penicillium crustosum]